MVERFGSARIMTGSAITTVIGRESAAAWSTITTGIMIAIAITASATELSSVHQ
jgi:hypothetical protein